MAVCRLNDGTGLGDELVKIGLAIEDPARQLNVSWTPAFMPPDGQGAWGEWGEWGACRLEIFGCKRAALPQFPDHRPIV